jgi:O-antigen ligase
MSGGSSMVFSGAIGVTPEPIRSSAKETVGNQKLSLTAAGAGFFFSFRAILVLVTGRWLRVGTEAGVIAELLIGFIVLLLTGFLAVGPASRPIGWVGRIRSFRWVILFLSFSCCSLFWSVTISTAASFFYWSAMAIDVTTVVLLLHSGPVTSISHSILKGFICSTCILAVIAWILPVAADLRLGDPEFFNTNQIGNLCAMAIFMAQFLLSRKDGKWGAVLLLLNLTLLRSLSKATLAGFLISQAYVLVNDPSTSRKRKTLLAFSSIAIALIFWGWIGTYYTTYTSAGQAETLTGRTAIWAYTLDAALDKPWIGNGIDSMWKVFPPFGPELFEARHAENELLQQFFAYGAVGIVMLIGLYANLCRRIRDLPIGRPRTVLIGLMLFIVIRGLAEAEPFDLLLPLWMITLMSAIVEPARMLTPDNQGAGIIAADSQLREQDLPVRGKPVL